MSQVQCIRSYQAQEHDELTLEKADVLQAKNITGDGESPTRDTETPDAFQQGSKAAGSSSSSSLFLVVRKSAFLADQGAITKEKTY